MKLLVLACIVALCVPPILLVLHLIRNRKLRSRLELWKTYALTLEVLRDCDEELSLEIPGEGCMTRSRRRAPILDQRDNALDAALDARSALEKTGEYV